MQRHPQLGIIDALGEGFSISQRALVALSIPVALDLLLWLGPRLRPASAVLEGLSRGDLGAHSQLLTGSADGLATGLAGLNLMALLVLGLVTLPTLMVAWQPPFGIAEPVWSVEGWAATVGATVGLFVLGLLLGVTYLSLLVRELDREADQPPLLRDIGLGFLRLAGTGALVLVVLVGIALPLSLLVGLLGQVSAGAASMALMVFSGAALAVWLYLFFTVNAIVLNRVGPLRGMWYSFTVVRLNLLKVLLFVFLINVILAGLTVVWRAIGQLHPLATVVAIVANALVGTAMAAATLVYYRDRYRLWRAARRASVRAPESE